MNKSKVMPKPEIVFAEFNSSDVITTSGEPDTMRSSGPLKASGFGGVTQLGGSGSKFGKIFQ